MVNDVELLFSAEEVWHVDDEIQFNFSPDYSPSISASSSYEEFDSPFTVPFMVTEKCFQRAPSLSESNRILHFLSMDSSYYCDPEYMRYHPDLNIQMRVMLIDWMVDVSVEFLLHRETLHLAVSIMDRFLSHSTDMKRARYQTLGITALFIAAKFEEIHPPKMKQFVAVCDGACSSSQIEELELEILFRLKWKILIPTCNFWLGLFLENACHVYPHEFMSNCGSKTFRPQTFSLIMNLIDISMHHPGFMSFPKSVIAAAAIYLFKQPKDKSFITAVTSFDFEVLAGCINWLAKFVDVSIDINPPDKLYRNIPCTDQHNIQVHNSACMNEILQLLCV